MNKIKQKVNANREGAQSQIQEKQYNFPYHYIPTFSEGEFSLVRKYNYGFRYTCSMNFIISIIKKYNFKSLCDVGTGDGRLIYELSTHFEDKDIVGVDYSENAINLAKAMNPGLNFQKIDVGNRKIEKQFDLLTLIEVFEHIEPNKCINFVKSLNSILKSNGHLILTVPHSNVPLIKKHFQHFTASSLNMYFEKYFKVKQIVYIEKRNIIEFAINKLLINKYIILNHKYLLRSIYKYYCNHLFFAEENKCGRILMVLEKR